MFRKLKPNGYVEPMPQKQLRRICRAFARQGGCIRMSKEIDEYLDLRGAEAITFDALCIFLHRKPGRAAVYEELIHTYQYRIGKNDGTHQSRILCEIEAQEQLLRYATAYRLTSCEICATEKALAEYRRQLKGIQEV